MTTTRDAAAESSRPFASQLTLSPLALSPLALSLLALSVVGIVAACAEGPRSPSDVPPARRLVLITLDTTRADHLDLYGYEEETAPNLRALAAEGAVFLDAYSASSWTLPSHASILTSLYPSEHGSTAIGSGETFLGRPLDESTATLAELLSEAGYRTGGFVGGPFLDPAFGIARGFDHYVYPEGDAQILDGRELLPEIVAWLDEVEDAGDPWFLFVNLFDPHAPYDPPAAALEALGSEIGEEADALRTFVPGTSPGPPAESQIEAITALYDAEIREADRVVGAILDAVRDASDTGDERTTIVVTADHGEWLGEQGLFGHGGHGFETQVRVPLVVADSSRIPHGRRVERLVDNRSVFRTLLRAAACPVPHEARGRDLVDLARAATGAATGAATQAGTQAGTAVTDGRSGVPALGAPGDDFVLTQRFHEGGHRFMLRRGTYKYFLDVRGDRRRERIVDLARDADEERLVPRGKLERFLEADPVLGRELSEGMDRLAESLDATLEAVHPAGLPDRDASVRGAPDRFLERLRALGYIGDAPEDGSVEGDAGGDGPADESREANEEGDGRE